jgi:GntR family transcriptional repressor for pyruvate dehydrogenase complex
MKFQAITKGKSIVEKVVDQLVTQVTNGKLKPGHVLPVDSRLAESFKVGRSTIREAMKVLEARGYVEIIPRQGFRVLGTPEKEKSDGQTEIGFDFGPEYHSELLEFFFSTFHGKILLACKSRSQDDVKKLKSLLKEIKEYQELICSGKASLGAYEKFANLLLQYHSCLGKTTHNILYQRVMDAVLANLRNLNPLTEILYTRNPDEVRKLRRHMEEMVHAIAARDGERAGRASNQWAAEFKKMLAETIGASVGI